MYETFLKSVFTKTLIDHFNDDQLFLNEPLSNNSTKSQ